MNHRGSVILHVLVTGVVVALLAALLLRMTMLRFMVTAHAHASSQMKRDDESALARIQSNWNSANAVCANNVPGYSCSGAAGTCACVCTPVSVGDPTVTVSQPGGAGTPCRLSIQSVDLMPSPL